MYTHSGCGHLPARVASEGFNGILLKVEKSFVVSITAAISKGKDLLQTKVFICFW